MASIVLLNYLYSSRIPLNAAACLKRAFEVLGVQEKSSDLCCMVLIVLLSFLDSRVTPLTPAVFLSFAAELSVLQHYPCNSDLSCDQNSRVNYVELKSLYLILVVMPLNGRLIVLITSYVETAF